MAVMDYTGEALCKQKLPSFLIKISNVKYDSSFYFLAFFRCCRDSIINIFYFQDDGTWLVNS